MQAGDSAPMVRRRLAISYTSKPVSGWGGLVPVIEYVERLGLRQVLAHALPDGRCSPNQIPVVDIVLVFLASVLTGARRFAHVERLRADAVVQAILGVQRMPSAMTVTRYFNGFVRSQVEHLATVLWRVTLARLVVPPLGAVLDLDSTVFERYGAQEGSRAGYNPHKPGRPLHHPLLALLAEAKIVLHVWLRSGNTTSATGVQAFLTEALAQLPPRVRLYALRADSGFFAADMLRELETRALPYAIAVRMTPHVKRAVAGLTRWTPFGPGLEVSDTPYQAPTWPHPRRVVVIRERVRERPEARGRQLLEVPGYTFHTLVTTLALPPAEVWHFYKARGDSENRLKELKDDFGANGFCLQSFDGTDAALRLICFLFNLLASFKREGTRDERPRLLTLRRDLLVTGAVLGAQGRTRVLRLGLRGRWRTRFAHLLARVAALPPTVAQAAKRVIAEGIPPPRPWRPRGADRIVPVQLRLRPVLN
jgi:hypothetical protein